MLPFPRLRPMTHDQTVLVTLVAYELVLVGIGLLAQRRTHDGLDFFLGARQLGPTVAAILLLLT